MAKLICLKQNKIHHLRTGIELRAAYQINLQLPFKFSCCQGNCGTCLIRVIKGMENLSPRTKQEEATLSAKQLDSSYRLACQCAFLGDVTLDA
jgi:ferredoxin